MTNRTVTALAMLGAAALGVSALLMMTRRAASGRISRVPVPDANLYAFEVEGRIGRAQIEGMARQLLAAFDGPEPVNILIDMPRFEGMTLGAALDPTGLLAEVRSLANVARYAVVGPPGWAAAMIRATDPLIPVEARVFAAGDLALAYDWARAGGEDAQDTGRAAPA